jgi:hypothetical protein
MEWLSPDWDAHLRSAMPGAVRDFDSRTPAFTNP